MTELLLSKSELQDLLPEFPRVVVMLATHNGLRWVQQQIASILAQNSVHIRLVISDDLSTDGTWEWLQAFAQVNSQVFLLPQTKRVGGASRNFFRLLRDTDFAEVEYVSFADQDDIWLPDKIWRAHAALTDSNFFAYSSNVLAFWKNQHSVVVHKAQAQVQWDFLFEAAGPGCTYVLRRELAELIQNTVRDRWSDIQLVGLHDWFFYAYSRANNYDWFIDDQIGMLYRQHGNNQVGVNKGWRALRHRATKVLSGWGLTQSALIADLVGLGDDPFVKRWAGGSRLGLLWLAAHAWQCRRRFRDKLLFALSCLLLSVAGERRQ
jgi:rhamnosyltransferase